MSNNLLNYQCPKCMAPLRFDANKQVLMCDFCLSEFKKELFETPQNIPQQNQNAANTSAQGVAEAAGAATAAMPGEQQSGQQAFVATAQKNRIDWKIEGVVEKHQTIPDAAGYVCSSCGAQVVTDTVTASTECLYCSNPVVISTNVSGMVEPDLVLPFKIDKNAAKERLKAFYKGKILMPNTFKNKNKIEKITGMYVPYWLFSCNGNGNANFKATKVRRWSDSNYNYTNTKTFDVRRAGSLAFSKVPVDASAKMDDSYMEGVEPFYLNEAVPFSPMYMAGFSADKFDVDVHVSTQRADERISASCVNALKNTVVGYNSIDIVGSDIDMNSQDVHYALLPVWILNTKYMGKLYKFMVNGQTGKVSGSLPVDKLKLWLWRIGIAAACALPFTYFIHYMFFL